MLLGLFLAGTMWFWILMAIAVLSVGLCVARESFGKATLCVVVTFAALALFGDFNVLHWLRDHYLSFGVYLVAYLAAGTVWSIVKWWRFIRRKRVDYDRRKGAFMVGHELPCDAPMPDKLKTEWRTHLEQERRYSADRREETFPPKANAYKAKIMAWMMYWPWSLVVTVIDDPIRKLFNAIFEAIRGLYQRIADSAFKDVEYDFKVTPPSGPPKVVGLPSLNAPTPTASGDEDTSHVRSV